MSSGSNWLGKDLDLGVWIPYWARCRPYAPDPRTLVENKYICINVYLYNLLFHKKMYIIYFLSVYLNVIKQAL